MKNHSSLYLYALLLLLMASMACNFTPQGGDTDRLSTVEAMETSIAATKTAVAIQEEATLTAEEMQLPATETAAIVEPTQDAQATSQAAALSATQAAVAPILTELPLYGVDPQQGLPGWIQPPLSLEVDQYHGTKFDNKFPMVIAKDFVMSADITWNTEYGGSGCAFVFRSDGDQQAPNQYLVIASRLAQGHVVFAVMAKGELITMKDFWANGIDPKFDDSNGATNRMTVVGRGTNFTIYTNGTELGDADPNDPLPALRLPEKPRQPPPLSDPVTLAAYRRALAEYQAEIKKLKEEYNRRVALWSKAEKNFEAGFTALGAVAESGRTLCEFDNAWLWLMGTP